MPILNKDQPKSQAQLSQSFAQYLLLKKKFISFVDYLPWQVAH